MIAIISTLMILGAAVVASAGFRKMQRSIPRDDFILHSAPDASTVHELVFAIQQKNLPELDTMLMERSTPGSSLYQHWLTFDEVGRMTSNEAGASAVVEWLTSNHIEVAWESAHRDYIKAVAPVSKWEQLLQTTFNVYKDLTRSRNTESESAGRFIRATEYSLPVEIVPHLAAVFNTVQVPPPLQFAHTTDGPYNINNDHNLRGDGITTMAFTSVTIDFLNDLYEIPSNEGDADQQQAVFETLDERFSPDDLTLFQQYFDLPIQSALDPSNFATNDCVNNSCSEGNLDLQYMMGISQHTETIFWHVPPDTDPFVHYVTDVADTSEPPLVHSISWGSVEQGRSKDTLDAFNTEAMKLSIMGVTIVVASGDDGASEDEVLCPYPSGSNDWNPGIWTGTPWTGKGYYPSFPATSPYVTAVGATMGPENGLPEIACQSQKGGVITSGGGFSTYYPTPRWQKKAVEQYFASLPENKQPTSGFNREGRAYPDVSLIGVWYNMFEQGQRTPVFGTSASAPVFGAMVSLANAARARDGKPSLGFLNPTLYHAGDVFTDITLGHNKCLVYGDIDHPSNAVCCDSGFYATTGWDPVTGLGSLKYGELETIFMHPRTGTDDDDGSEESTGLTTGAIVGIVVGGTVFLLFGTAVVLFVAGVISSATPIVPLTGTAAAGAPSVLDQPVQAAVHVKAGGR